MDIRTVVNDLNQVTVFTNSGVQLVGTEAAQLSFNPQGTMTPNTLYNCRSDQEQRRHHHDQFPAWRQLRSGVDQLDPFGQDRRLSRAARQHAGEGAGAGRPVRGVDVERAVGQDDGGHRRSRVGACRRPAIDLDLTGLQSGNVMHVTYKDNTTGITHNLSIVRVDDPSVLPLSNTTTLDPNDEVLGINFSGGMASVVTQLNAALGASANLQFSNPSGSTLARAGRRRAEPLGRAGGVGHHDDVVAHQRQCRSFRCSPTMAALYTGAITANGSQQTGLAGRISVNLGLLGDPSRTIVFSTSPLTAAGDTTRSDFILTQLHVGDLSLFAADRHRHHRRSVHRHAVEFRQAVHQPAGRSRDRRQAAVRRPGRGAEHPAEEGDAMPRASISTTRWRICWRCRMPIPPMRASCRPSSRCTTR